MSAAVGAWETDPDVDPDVFVPAFSDCSCHRAAVRCSQGCCQAAPQGRCGASATDPDFLAATCARIREWLKPPNASISVRSVRFLLDTIDAQTATIEALRSRPWLAIDSTGTVTECVSEQHAIDMANLWIEEGLDDGDWDDSVTGIRVAQVAHEVRKVVLARAEMEPAAWDELTGCCDEDEWWDFNLVPVPPVEVSP